jgi:hypothetical protein
MRWWIQENSVAVLVMAFMCVSIGIIIAGGLYALYLVLAAMVVLIIVSMIYNFFSDS